MFRTDWKIVAAVFFVFFLGACTEDVNKGPVDDDASTPGEDASTSDSGETLDSGQTSDDADVAADVGVMDAGTNGDAGLLTCEESCSHGASICPMFFEGVTQEQCVSSCEEDSSQEFLACNLAAQDCDDLVDCKMMF